MVDEFGGIPEAELFSDAVAVCVDGFDAEMEDASDFVGILAMTEQPEDSELAVGESGGGGLAAAGT